jgi:histidinol-phosphate aminotransferase
MVCIDCQRLGSGGLFMTRIHGGTDALGTPRFDFSSNSNACGPCPAALALTLQADASSYPDANYTALRVKLAAFHGVESGRVVLAGSASEFIFRITAMVAKQTMLQGKVSVPTHSYGDYAHAAKAWDLEITPNPAKAQLVWACEPSSPLGIAHEAWPSEVQSLLSVTNQTVVLDCAYEPLRLSGQSSLSEVQRDRVWQLWTPNKALGLTGVRAAYAISPADSKSNLKSSAQTDALMLEQLGASWPVGAHGVALLTAWTEPEVQTWLKNSLHTLKLWKSRQIHLLQSLGWTCLTSGGNFFCIGMAKEPKQTDIHLSKVLLRLREQGIKLRDATSFGLPKFARVSVQTPTAQDALVTALKAMQ